jgi:hypothetical protein
MIYMEKYKIWWILAIIIIIVVVHLPYYNKCNCNYCRQGVQCKFGENECYSKCTKGQECFKVICAK